MAENHKFAHTAPAESRRSYNKRVTGRICEHMTYSAREAFKRLRTNVMIALPDSEKKCHVIGVTSALVSEGKSTVSVNLAYSLAELGKSVLLIDGDMRRPSLHDKLELRAAPGLSEVLTAADGGSGLIVRYTSSLNSTHFDVIPAGSIPENPSELLNSPRFQRLIELVSESCDYIIIDLPPVNAVIDAINVINSTDGMLVVLREKHCPRFMLSDCIDQLRFAKANILGFVVNGCVDDGKHYAYSRSKYYGYYK